MKIFTFRWCDAGVWVTSEDNIRYWAPLVGSLGLLISKRALWIGAHWSGYNKRLCVNLIPCVTLWVTLPGGKEP